MRLRLQLQPLARAAGLTIWDPSEIAAGARWREEFTAALAGANAVVLLLSAELLADAAFEQEYLPRLVAAARRGSLALLSVEVGACPYTATPLVAFPPLNAGDDPLDFLRAPEAERRLLALARTIVARGATGSL
jgi:hypothetical protein